MEQPVSQPRTVVRQCFVDFVHFSLRGKLPQVCQPYQDNLNSLEPKKSAIKTALCCGEFETVICFDMPKGHHP